MKPILPFLLAAALLLNGCVSPPPPLPPPPAPTPPPTPTPAPEPLVYVEQLPSVVDEVLDYGSKVRSLSAAELGKELNALAANPAGPQTTLKRVLVLSRMHGNGELGRALGLLDGLLKSADAELQPFKPLATVLQMQLNERRRSDEQADRLGQQLKDEQRRADEAIAKLDALKKIESTLPARPGAPAAK
ncbi:hypothetical protein N8I74_16735 [Chitiniphilus purpureus]|uniref:Permease n=1 Tax=Chitiniphilus purpureus TaxID=2981137 RepID=A0ABY6DKQ7_9NEIS|nr:hypothetical protein [Chitiniphilus sp. CD1]UXY14945.1 hypothetical protein N8I74_16735 [Chitiniphilus sp. CD1]